MIFPVVSGSNLLRQKMTLPADFQGGLNVVFVPFMQWHQMEVNSWVPKVQDLEREYPGLCYYELPTIQSRNAFSQMFINEGMRAGIPDPKTRERTITLYLDKQNFRQSLEMQEEDHTYVLLVDRQGKVYWQARGAFTPEAGESLQKAVSQFNPEAVAEL
jgi:hypothetical protein